MNAPEQPDLEGIPAPETPHMIARVNARAIKTVFPFVAKKDIRLYLNGVNIRPLEDGSVMVVATDGHRYVVVHDANGYAEHELTVSIYKDALKHCTEATHTVDVLSNGHVIVSGPHAEPLFLQPGNALLDGDYPRIERVASTLGYTEGITGAMNPKYLLDALEISEQYGSVRFFTRDADSPLCFVFGGIGDLECFGGIMKLKDSFDSLPAWFPKPGAVETLADV